MPEPGMGGSRGRSGSGMGAGTGRDEDHVDDKDIVGIGYDLGAILDKVAKPGSIDWGLGPEGHQTTVGGRRPGEDRDFGDDVSLQQKTAFMQKNPPASRPTSKPSAITALKSNLAKKGYKAKPTPLQNKQAFMDKNPFGHPSSFTTKSPDQPTNSPMSWSDIAKTDMENKKHSAVSMPSDWMAQNIFDDESKQTAALLGPLFSGESHPTYAPHTYSVGGGYSGGPATQTWAGNWGKMMSANKPTVNMRYGTTDWIGSLPPGVGRSLNSLMEKYKEKTDLEKQASENSGISRFFPGGYSPTGNIYNRSILEANLLADKYANMYGLPEKSGKNPATPNRWGLYDLARHGFLASQVGLVPAQYAETFRSTGQSSDYTNNMLANRFMRQHQRPLGASGILSKNFGLSPVELTSDMYGNPASPSARPSTPTDAWMKIVQQEMMNPGSTGYDIDFNVSD